MSPLSKRWTKLSVLLLTAWLVAGTGSASPRNYTAVIDAGSSGSRVHLYERTVVGVNAEVRSIFSKQGGRPMSSFAASPNDAGPIGVKPLLDELSAALAGINVLPHQVHVHLLATAGMRLIEERNQIGRAHV